MKIFHDVCGFTVTKIGTGALCTNYATAYIGFGVINRRSSTGIYLEDAMRQNDIPVNEKNATDTFTVAFV